MKRPLGIACGLVIKQLRIDAQLTQKALGEQAGTDRTYIYKMECGYRIPGLHMLIAIAKVLNIRPSLLVSQIEDTNPTIAPPAGNRKLASGTAPVDG